MNTDIILDPDDNNNPSIGLIYLIQEPSHVDVQSDLYTVGMSNKNTLTRIKSYGEHTRIYMIHACLNPRNMEKILKEKFSEKFTHVKGSPEQFRGNIIEMIQVFNTVINCASEFLNDDINEDNKENNDIQESEKVIEINTTKELYAHTDIKQIIITKKNPTEGCVKLNDNNYWLPIWEWETLGGWINRHIEKYAKDFNLQEGLKLRTHIINTCYIPYPPFVELAYHQIRVYQPRSNSDSTLDCNIIDLKTKVTTTDFGTSVNFPRTRPCDYLKSFPSCDLKQFEKYITTWIDDYSLKYWKRFCQSIFIEPCDYQKIFYDYDWQINEKENDTHYRLFTWLRSAHFKIYNIEPLQIKKIDKIDKQLLDMNKRSKFVILYSQDNIQDEINIKKLIEQKFYHILIVTSDINKIKSGSRRYNHNGLKSLLETHKSHNVEDENSDEESNEDTPDIEAFFENERYYFSEFFWWTITGSIFSGSNF